MCEKLLLIEFKETETQAVERHHGAAGTDERSTVSDARTLDSKS